VAGAVLLVWGGLCWGAYHYSCSQRGAYLAEVQTLAKDGQPDPEEVVGPQIFSGYARADRSAPQKGYLLTIRAGNGSARLTCRHVHVLASVPALADWPKMVGSPWREEETISKEMDCQIFQPCLTYKELAYGTYRCLITHHDLFPGRDQFFFVSCLQNASYGDMRAHLCAVSLEGDARITDCKQLDLSRWTHGPMSTVFLPGKRQPGSPRVHMGLSSWTTYGLPY
jgi:hypothetical protein